MAQMTDAAWIQILLLEIQRCSYIIYRDLFEIERRYRLAFLTPCAYTLVVSPDHRQQEQADAWT
jgi:hypothetical protein